MKRRIPALLLALALLFTLAACRTEDPVKGDASADDAAQTSGDESLDDSPDETTEDDGNSEDELTSLREDYEALQEAYHVLQAENKALFQACRELRGLLDYHAIERVELTGSMFAPDTVEAHGLPLEESAVIGTCRDMLVDVCLTVQNGENLWSLVHLLNPAEHMDTVGWVSWNELVPYDPLTMETLLTYPVRVRPGTVLRDDVRGNELVSDGTSSYLVEYTETDTVIVHDSGGITCRVTRSDLIYPTVQNGKIVWDG